MPSGRVPPSSRRRDIGVRQASEELALLAEPFERVRIEPVVLHHFNRYLPIDLAVGAARAEHGTRSAAPDQFQVSNTLNRCDFPGRSATASATAASRNVRARSSASSSCSSCRRSGSSTTLTKTARSSIGRETAC